MNDPVDTVAPWTIKAVATKTREAVTNAARREGLTVGQWLERRVQEWEGEGSPVHVAQAPAVPVNLADVAAMMQGMAALAGQGAAIPPELLKDAALTTRRAMRQARVAQSRRGQAPAGVSSVKLIGD